MLRFWFLCVICGFCLLHSQASYAIETKAKQAILIDDTTNTVLFEKDADALMHPSSMSKLMTVYVLFKRLSEGGLKLTDTFPVSEKAWRMQGSKTWVALNSQVSVEDLIRGIVIQSGNDACIVVAEGLAGSEEAFANEMNRQAKELGLKQSHFVNATGWPDENHLMTARDLAALAHHLIHDFPQYYHYFAEKEFTYNKISQPNRDTLLNSNIGVDGLKTGHTEAGGYGIVNSAIQNGRRLITVVNGLGNEKERAQESESLLRAGFRDFENITLVKKGMEIDNAEVFLGQQPSVPLVAGEDLLVTVPRAERRNIRVTLTYQDPLKAPVKKGTHVADLRIEIPSRKPALLPLLAGASVEEIRGIARLIPAFSHFILKRH